MSYNIHKVGIIGAGTMGGGIAAHLANIGVEVILLDIPTPGKESDSAVARNELVQGLFQKTLKARPANFAVRERSQLVSLGNIQDDLERLADCDWVIEVIIEQLEPKKQLMARLEQIVAEDAIISSNTSGIPITSIVEDCSEQFKRRFLGTHFFNPPRYLQLLELIPTEWTDPAIVDFMVGFGRNVLGKGVVICKDTPNFIANRFMSITGAYATEYALQNGYSIPEVDMLTGPLIGRPKTGTFRLGDLVGIDVMHHVGGNLYDLIADDKYRDVLRAEKANELTNYLLVNRWLGNKTGQGYYKQERRNGSRAFLAINPESREYEESDTPRFESVGKVRKIDDLGQRLQALLAHNDRAAELVRELLYFNFAYAAYVSPQIAYSIVDIDNANRWGFSHEAGPFELWDMLGVRETVAKMEAAGHEVADWVKQMLADGNESFYRNGSYYDFQIGSYKSKSRSAFHVKLAETDVVAQNGSARLRDMGDGVAILEFNSKMNAIDGDIVEMMDSALERLNSDFDALVIGNEGRDFCVGANIANVAIAASQGMFDQIEQSILALQQATFRLKHAPKPVVTAPHQRVLGGGVEVVMGSWATVADHESYLGLVEVGVGLIPAGGGCKEVLVRLLNPVMKVNNADPLPVLQEIFTNIATAKVATSAHEAKKLGYLREQDIINFNSSQRLARAKQLALQLIERGARSPLVEQVYAVGREYYSTLQMGIKSFRWGNYASDHDALISEKLAFVLCGGDLSHGQWVDPWHILDLEREAFLSLTGEKKTQERIMHMLQTGKPLRN